MTGEKGQRPWPSFLPLTWNPISPPSPLAKPSPHFSNPRRDQKKWMSCHIQPKLDPQSRYWIQYAVQCNDFSISLCLYVLDLNAHWLCKTQSCRWVVHFNCNHFDFQHKKGGWMEALPLQWWIAHFLHLKKRERERLAFSDARPSLAPIPRLWHDEWEWCSDADRLTTSSSSETLSIYLFISLFCWCVYYQCQNTEAPLTERARCQNVKSSD